MKEIKPEEAFKLYLEGNQLEYFAYEVWWELDDYSPLILFKKCERWRLK